MSFLPFSLGRRFSGLNAVAGDLVADVAHDPGRIRLFNAVRAVIASLVVAVTLYHVAVRFGHPIALVVPGVLISFLWVLLTRETTLRGHVEVLLASSAAIAATVIIIPHLAALPRWFGAMYICLGMFFGTLVQDYLRRASAVTLMWFIATCVELYLNPPICAVPFQIASVVIGAAVTFVVCILLLAHSPTRVLRSALADFQWNAEFIRCSALDRPPQVKAYRTAKLRACARLGRTIAVIDGELSARRFAQSDSLFHALARAHAVCCYLTNAEAPIAIDTRSATMPGSGRTAKTRDRLSVPIAVLDDSLSTLRAIAGVIDVRSVANRRKTQFSVDSLAWRPAIQVVAALAIALLLADLLAPGRWYWAVVTANAVLSRSKTGTLRRSCFRLIGTVIGLVIGLLAGWLVGGNLILTCAVMLAAVFALHFCIPENYGIGVLFATIFVGLLYVSLGFSEAQILLTRLEETGIGVLAAVVVTIAVLPARALSEASAD